MLGLFRKSTSVSRVMCLIVFRTNNFCFTDVLVLTIRQTQKPADNVLLFNFPLTVRFRGKSGQSDQTIKVKEKEETFYFPLDSAPEIVRLDPNLTLLAKTTFNVPTPMLYKQLVNRDDMVGRLIAVAQLENKQDKESVAKLKEALNHDSFYGVRLEAGRALLSIHTDEALDALLASTDQADARVRREVVAALAGFYRESAYDSAVRTLGREKNPDIQAAAIRGLGGYAKPEAHETLLKFLNSESYRNVLASAAIGAMRSQDDPAYIGPMLDVLGRREGDFAGRDYAQGLGAVAYLARNEEKKDGVREFLIGRVNDSRKTVQLAAINALGTLDDPRAISVLETFASASRKSPERTAAEQSLAELRTARKPVDDFKNLRQEVMDLEKANRELRKDLDDLKKRVGARDARKSGTK